MSDGAELIDLLLDQAEGARLLLQAMFERRTRQDNGPALRELAQRQERYKAPSAKGAWHMYSESWAMRRDGVSIVEREKQVPPFGEGLVVEFPAVKLAGAMRALRLRVTSIKVAIKVVDIRFPLLEWWNEIDSLNGREFTITFEEARAGSQSQLERELAALEKHKESE